MDVKDRDKIIEKYMAFIIKTASDTLGRYISIENDDEFSIALNAFDESITKYDERRGSLLGFARLVIENRLKNHMSAQKKNKGIVSLDRMMEDGFDVPDERRGESDALHDEMIDFRHELEYFGLDLERLAENGPKHRDTRANAADAADKVSKDSPTVEITYRKRRLPIRRVAVLTEISEKIIRRSSDFIIACMIILIKDFTMLKEFIKGTVR